MMLGGLTRIDGYVIDESTNDVILFGDADTSSPRLYTEDFVVALRNVWGRYDSAAGNTICHSAPGCSIDPDPEVFRKVMEIGSNINSLSRFEDIEKEIARWNEICRRPQAVRVMGVKFDTRFGKTMVDADYLMKRLTNGSVTVDHEGFNSLIDLTLQEIKEAVTKGRQPDIPISTMNRFWFYPGKTGFRYDEGVGIIDSCPVILLTESQHIARDGGLVDSGERDPLASEYAAGFSAHYSTIAVQLPIYSELQSLFQHVALARMIHERAANSSDYLAYLLDDMKVAPVNVPRSLGGIPDVRQFEHRRDYSGGYEIVKFWLPSCGGVTIDIPITPRNFTEDRQGSLRELRGRILRSMPAGSGGGRGRGKQGTNDKSAEHGHPHPDTTDTLEENTDVHRRPTTLRWRF
jgi:hypothetical protein